MIDHVLVDAQDNSYTAANSPTTQAMTGVMAVEPSQEKVNASFAEMKSIGLLIGNLALDGISAREMLTEAVLQYKFVDRIINALTSSQTADHMDAIECSLWALENLLQDQPKKSYCALSKKAYNVVKQLNLV